MRSHKNELDSFVIFHIRMAGTELIQSESHPEVIWCTSEQPVNLVIVAIMEYFNDISNDAIINDNISSVILA